MTTRRTVATAVDWAYLIGWLERRGLPLFFVILGAGPILGHALAGRLAIDAGLYTDAARDWLQGRNAWETSATDGEYIFHFSGLPPTVIIFAPFALLSTSVSQAIWLVGSVLAAVFTVRRLSLPWYWLLFPPMVEGVFVANPHVVLLALLLTRLAWVAPLLKIYALVPIAGEVRARQVILFGACIALSLVLFPSLWTTYVSNAGPVNGRLVQEAGGGWSSTSVPHLVIPTAIALGVVALADVRTAAWLFVPAISPASQFFYSTLALPVMNLPLAIILSINARGSAGFAVIVLAFLVLAGRKPRTIATYSASPPPRWVRNMVAVRRVRIMAAAALSRCGGGRG